MGKVLKRAHQNGRMDADVFAAGAQVKALTMALAKALIKILIKALIKAHQQDAAQPLALGCANWGCVRPRQAWLVLEGAAQRAV